AAVRSISFLDVYVDTGFRLSFPARRSSDLGDIGEEFGMIACQCGCLVNDHVDLIGAVADGLARFESFSFWCLGTGRKLKLSKRADRKSTRLNSSHVSISYSVFCFKKKIRYL